MLEISQKRSRSTRPVDPSSSPIQHLPVEILYRIFSLLLRLDVNDTLAIHTSSPWVLTRVCSHWKSFMLSFPELWSTIDIRIPKHKAIPQNAHCLLETWLHHAGTDTPLSITFQCWDTSYSAQELLMTCISVCKRWERASLHIPVILLPCLNEVAGKLPLLRQLHLAMLEGGLGTMRPVWLSGDFVTAFVNAPRLRDVKLRQICDIANSVRLPWSQLTSYDSVEHIASDHITVLDRMKNNIVECNLYSEITSPHSSSPSRFISCTRLRRLEVRNCSLLDYLDAPRLDQLIISDLTLRNSENLLHNFLLRSACSLKSLDISNTMLQNEQIISVLSFADSIQDLRVWLGFEFASRFIRALTPGRSANIQVPQVVVNHGHRRFTVSYDHAPTSPTTGAPLSRTNSLRRLPSVAWPIRKKTDRNTQTRGAKADSESEAPLLPNLRHLRVNLVSCHRQNFAELVGMVEKRWLPTGGENAIPDGRRYSGFFKKRSESPTRASNGMVSLKSLEVIATGQIATPHLVDEIRSYEEQGLDLKMHLWRDWTCG